MFKVICKTHSVGYGNHWHDVTKEYTVYAVNYHPEEGTHFLVYTNRAWKWIGSSDCKPLDRDD